MTSIFVLVAVLAVLNGVMDMNFNMYGGSIFSDEKRFNPQFWNPGISWQNKWKNGDHAQGEKFFGSSTFLSPLTDSWHLFKCLFLTGVFITVLLPKTLLFNLPVDFLICNLIWGLFFELTLRVLKRKS
jgi:hypothetical protein